MVFPLVIVVCLVGIGFGAGVVYFLTKKQK